MVVSDEVFNWRSKKKKKFISQWNHWPQLILRGKPKILIDSRQSQYFTSTNWFEGGCLFLFSSSMSTTKYEHYFFFVHSALFQFPAPSLYGQPDVGKPNRFLILIRKLYRWPLHYYDIIYSVRWFVFFIDCRRNRSLKSWSKYHLIKSFMCIELNANDTWI